MLVVFGGFWGGLGFVFDFGLNGQQVLWLFGLGLILNLLLWGGCACCLGVLLVFDLFCGFCLAVLFVDFGYLGRYFVERLVSFGGFR